MPDIWFPNLGIKISHLSKSAFSIFGLEIAWYGIIIAIGVIAGYLVAAGIAKKTKQNPEMYLDFLIFALIFAIIGARLYYVIFSWDQYKDNLLQIFNLRNGGLAIFGGVIGAVATAVVFCKKKKYDFWLLADTAVPGLILGQAIGRWGNFFNQEAFGGFSDGLFAMRLNVETAAYTTQELLQKAVEVGGTTYIQVHPTFLYESVWCLVVFAIMLLVWKKRKFGGQIFSIYLIGYGLGRVWIEGLRTDQLLLWNTQIPVSQLLSLLLVIGGIALLYGKYRPYRLQKQENAMKDVHFAPGFEQSRPQDTGENVESTVNSEEITPAELDHSSENVKD